MPIICPLAFREAAPIHELLPLLAFGEVPSACGALRMTLEAPLSRSKTILMRVGSLVCSRAFGSKHLVPRHCRPSFSDVDTGAAVGHCG